MDKFKGYKTFIVSGLLVIVGLINLLAGDISLTQFLSSPDLLVILGGLGLAGLRDAV